MKKLISIVLCMFVVFFLNACGQGNNESIESSETSVKSIIQNNITDSDRMMNVETSIGVLKYPEKWKDKISFDAEDDKVNFNCGNIKLFTLYFGGEKGEVFGTLHLDNGEIPLRYEMYTIDTKSKNYNELSAMQEDVNVIFQYLISEGKLKVK